MPKKTKTSQTHNREIHPTATSAGCRAEPGGRPPRDPHHHHHHLRQRPRPPQSSFLAWRQTGGLLGRRSSAEKSVNGSNKGMKASMHTAWVKSTPTSANTWSTI